MRETRWWPLMAMLTMATLALAAATAAQDEPGAPAFTPVEPIGATVEAQPGDGRVWTLSACLDTALVQNEAVRAERERRQEISGQKYQAVSNALPSVDLTGDWSRGRDPSFAFNESFGGGGESIFPTVDPSVVDPWFTDWLGGFGSFIPAAEDIPAQTFYQAKATMTWELNVLKVLGAVGAANVGLDRQGELIRAAEHQVAEQVVNSYFQIISLAEALRSAEARQANQMELLDLVRLRYELGTAARLDTLQAAVAVANVQPEVRNLAQAVRDAGARLNALMGRPPAAPLTIANELPLEREDIDPEAALRLAMNRPDLVAQDLSVRLLERQRQVHVADQRPYLSLFGSYGYVGKTVDTLFDEGHDTWSASVSVTVPVFNGLMTKGLVDETDARIRRTEVEISGQRRLARVEVREILNNLATSRENLRTAELGLELAEEALEESLLAYRIGRANYLEALEAQANHVDARRNLIEARYTVLTRLASLKRAIGHSPATPLSAIAGLTAGQS